LIYELPRYSSFLGAFLFLEFGKNLCIFVYYLLFSQKTSHLEQEFFNGLELSIINARNFFDDAEILEKNKRRVRSYTFYQLCIEECGRFYMIYNCLRDYYKKKQEPKELNYGKLKKLGFDKHTEKTEINFSNLILTNMVFLEMSDLKGNQYLENKLIQSIQYLTSLKDQLNYLKNESLYVSFTNNKFTLPGENISLYEYDIVKNLANISIRTIEKLKEYYDYHGGFRELKKQYIPE